MRKLFIACTCMFTSLAACAQPQLDIINIAYQRSPPGVNDGGGDVRCISEAGLSLKAPVKQENGDVVLLGLSGSIGMIPLVSGHILHFGSAGMQLGYIRKHSERLSIQAVLLPKINSGLKKLGKGAVQPGGVLLFTEKRSEKLKLKYGAYYNRECFGNFFVPMIGVDWKPSGRLQVYGVLPMNATVVYKALPGISAGANFTGIISSYALGNSMYLHKASNELWLFADGYVTKSIVLQPRVGCSLGRSYRIYASDDKIDLGISALKLGDDRVRITDDINDGLLVQLSLLYRVPVE